MIDVFMVNPSTPYGMLTKHQVYLPLPTCEKLQFRQTSHWEDLGPFALQYADVTLQMVPCVLNMLIRVQALA